MYVRVDDGDGISLGIGTCYSAGNRSRPCSSFLYEFASIHFGFLLCAILSAAGFESICDYIISFQPNGLVAEGKEFLAWGKGDNDGEEEPPEFDGEARDTRNKERARP
jgi:hypothetical protein